MLTVREVADSLKLTTKTVYKLILNGELPAIRVGGQWRIAKVELDRFLQNGHNVPAA
jgi:excisionase family DNA binding protein